MLVNVSRSKMADIIVLDPVADPGGQGGHAPPDL